MSYLDDQRIFLRQESFRARIDEIRQTWGPSTPQSANGPKAQPTTDRGEERQKHKEEKSMVCGKCGAEIPPGKLACDCFQVEADNEVEKRALERFQKGGTLWTWSKKGRVHLLPSVEYCLTLCRKERIKKPTSIRVFYGPDLKLPNTKDRELCELCRRKAEEALKDAPFRGEVNHGRS